MKFAWVIFLSLTAQALPGQPPAPALEKAQRGLVKVQTDIPFMGPLSGNYHWTGTRLAGCDFCADATPTLWAVDRQGEPASVGLKYREGRVYCR